MNKNYWKKLGIVFNEHADQDTWKAERSIKISHTSLFPNHTVGRGPNSGEVTLLDFSTRLTEARGVYFHYESKYKSVTIYINSKSESPDSTFFDTRKNGKSYAFTYRYRTDMQDQFGWLVKELMVGKEYCDVDDIREALKVKGYSIVAEFQFTNIVSFSLPHHGSGGFIRPEYVKPIKNGIEIGWISSGTYNSIPNVVKIERTRGIKTKSLSKLGLESKGYYSHHYHCNILPEQAQQAKRFFGGRFKRGES